jgi:exodeoxyribonuclease VII small subunit
LDVTSTDVSFEQAFSALEEIVSKLECGGLTLEQAVALYEEGMRLAGLCGQRLDGAELRVSSLTLTESGQQTEIPWEERP